MNGKQLLKNCPEKIILHAESENLKKLEKCQDENSFIATLEEQAQKCDPCWIYGFPRTGSSWLCKHFFGKFTKSEFFEPFDLFQCSSTGSSTETINTDSAFENARPEIIKHLKLFNDPEDRLLLAMHKSFVFKFLFDFNIVPELIKLFPNSRFIWLTRDSRDAVESFANPDMKHWPSADFSYLGSDAKVRFEGALKRWLKYTLHQIKVFNLFKDRILKVKYEDFAQNFIKTSKLVLKFSRVPGPEPLIYELSEKFNARHGLWKDWDDWKRELFIESGSQKLNKMLGYENRTENSQYIWEKEL